MSVVSGSLGRMLTTDEYVWPGPIVIGQLGSGDLGFLPEAYLVARAADLDRWREVTTWGQARVVAHEDRCLAPPFFPEDLDADEDGEGPFAVAELGVVADGDWPPPIAALALELARRHELTAGASTIGTEVETVFNGPILAIKPDQEDALRAALEEAGCSVGRDDDLMCRAEEV